MELIGERKNEFIFTQLEKSLDIYGFVFLED